MCLITDLRLGRHVHFRRTSIPGSVTAVVLMLSNQQRIGFHCEVPRTLNSSSNIGETDGITVNGGGYFWRHSADAFIARWDFTLAVHGKIVNGPWFCIRNEATAQFDLVEYFLDEQMLESVRKDFER